MTPTQAAALVDELIAEKNLGPSPLAVKYAGYLADHLDFKQELSAADLAQMKKDCAAFVDVAHAEAISRLKEELANDPAEVGYAGETPEELQKLLTVEQPIYAESTQPLSEEELVNVAAAKIRGEVYEPVRVKTQVLVAVKPPRLGTIWTGIPYARNLPSLDNIKEAL